MTIFGYDTVSPTFEGGVPSNAQAILFYLDGNFPNEAGARNRFPQLFANGHVVGYTVTQRVPSQGDDFEPGNRMGDIGAWVEACKQLGVFRPVCYADGSDMAGLVFPELERVFGSPLPPPGIDRPFRTILANPDGDPTIPPDHDGKQYWFGSIQGGGRVDMDINALRDDFFLKVVPPPPPPKDTMELISNGQNYPNTELFVLLDSGEVKHIRNDPKVPLHWWEDKDGGPNWLSLGNPNNKTVVTANSVSSAVELNPTFVPYPQ